MVILRVHMKESERLSKIVTHVKHAPVGTDVPGLDSQQALTTALSPPTATHTVFFLGCYSPVCGSAQVLPAPGNGQAFSGLWCPLIASTKRSEHLWNHSSATPSWLVLKQPCLLHLWIPRIYPRVQNTGSAKHIPMSEFRGEKGFKK